MPILPRGIPWSAVRQVVFSVKSLPLWFFILFIAINTCKIAVFNYLIVSAGDFPSAANLIPGFLNKLIIVAVFFIILCRFRTRIIVITLYLLQTAYIAVNLTYFFSFQGYLHISQYFGLFSEAFDLLAHSALPWDLRPLFILVDLPFFIGMLITYRSFQDFNRRRLFKPVLYTFSVIFIIYFYKWDVPHISPLKQMNNAYESDIDVVEKYGLLTFNIMDLLNFNEARSHIRNLNYGPVVSTPDTAAGRRNIVLLQIESLDAYFINDKYKNKFIMPYLHSLANECLFFPYLLSYHLAGSTSDCEFSVLNSVEPFDDFPSIKIRNYDYPNSLLKRFTRNGYAAIAFHGNKGSFFNRNSAFKKMGFQKFYDELAMNVPDIGWGATDESVLDFVKSRLPQQKQPFLYHIITMSSHEPFTLVRPYYHNAAYDEIKDGVTRNLFNSFSYVDNLLKKFIPAVRAACPNTVIFIYGDHTPVLPKCDYRKATYEIDSRIFEFVPLCIITPEKTVYREQRYAASFLDIAPTALAASGIRDSIRSYGLDLLSLPSRDRDIPLRLGIFSRKTLFDKISRKK